MSASQDKAANRKARRAAKSASHEPFLRLVQDEVRRRPTRPTVKEIKPLNDAQKRYDSSITANTITFGIGPAGTGKTWFAAMRAAEELAAGRIERIIITRPAVSADEDLGFLPGELNEKYEPYFRPVRDALEEYFGSGHLEYLIKSGVIEARPLGLIRGATIKNTWLIADEMQNATVGQTKLLLTRIGENAKFIINGDPTQCDLPPRSPSGLVDAVNRLRGVRSVGTVKFTVDDVVRSGLCMDIIRAYEHPHVDRYNEDSEDAGVMRTLGYAGEKVLEEEVRV